MLKPHYFVLLASLMGDGSTAPPQPAAVPPALDAGTRIPPPSTPAVGVDAGPRDAGLPTSSPDAAHTIHWPKDLRPLATLDGPAVLAAHAALQQVLSRFPKEYAGACEYSAKSMQVVVGQEGSLYFVRIDRRADKCGWPRGAQLEFDWFELYAVSPEGKVLARYPYMP